MTTTERDESVTTITGAAPGVIAALKRATEIAAEHGHNYVGIEDVLAALLVPSAPIGVLEYRWQQHNGGAALTFSELRELVESIVPGPVRGIHGPAEPAVVTYDLSGPNADELGRRIG